MSEQNPEPDGMTALRGKMIAYVQRLPAYEGPLIVCADGTVVDTEDWTVVATGEHPETPSREQFGVSR